MPKTLVIAEGGSGHDGDPRKMQALIRAAAEAGADMLKLQWTSDPRALAERRHAPALREVYDRYLAWPKGWHRGLADSCRARGLLYGCTVFLPCDVATVAPHVAHFKVASFEAQAHDLIAAHERFLEEDARQGRERWVISSRGLGADHAFGLAYKHLHLVKFLLCTSAYPAPVEALNLRRFHLSSSLDEDVLDGLSDHSPPDHTWTGALAVAAGAEIIERHLRLDDTDTANPDYPHSLTPRAFADYVRHIRYTEACLGDGRMRAQDCEAPLLQYRVVTA